MIKKSEASAVWQGDLKSGKGTLTSKSGVLKSTPYSFADRFEGASGTTPEELIAAAHAGCFAMALSSELGKAGFTPTRLDAEATVSLDFVDNKPTVTTSAIKLVAKIPGITPDKFNEIAAGAKANCPISRLLTAAITLDAKLEA